MIENLNRGVRDQCRHPPVGKHGWCVGLYVEMCTADVPLAFVIDFNATPKRDSFARLPGIQLLAHGG